MNVIISQALATGLPVITTKHSGLPEQVQDGVNGFLVAEGDYQALAEKIVEMINHPEKWAEFGRHGRAVVEAKYNANILIEAQIKMYKDLLK